MWKQAKDIVSRYRIVLTPEPEVGFVGASVELPLVMADGPTLQACYAQTLDAQTAAVATLLEQGQRPPAPAQDEKREDQLNIRLTANERTRLQEAARQAGFRSLSDFVRTAALNQAG